MIVELLVTNLAKPLPHDMLPAQHSSRGLNTHSLQASQLMDSVLCRGTGVVRAGSFVETAGLLR